jgi:hypothetical protein
MSAKLRIVVLGYLVRGPLGGLAWHHLQYVLGLQELGHDVWFIEDSDDYPSCYDASKDETGVDPTYGLAFTAAAFERLGLGTKWAYFDAHRSTWLGPGAAEAPAACRSADAFLNVSGVNPVRSWLDDTPVRVLIDTDPAFTQIRHLTEQRPRELAAAHNAFFTFGENFGQPGCGVPDDGIRWQPTRQPIHLPSWQPTPGAADAPLTTVMQWDSYATRSFRGVEYGMKSASFEAFIDLPRAVDRRFAIAVGSPTAPRARLEGAGWSVLNPLAITRDPWTYQAFIDRSSAEFSVAKHAYVVTRSGWFSERSAAYLASGRPVVVQDTAFGEWMPMTPAVETFTRVEEAVDAVSAISIGYGDRCRAARSLANEAFDARRVLAELLERADRPARVKPREEQRVGG